MNLPTLGAGQSWPASVDAGNWPDVAGAAEFQWLADDATAQLTLWGTQPDPGVDDFTHPWIPAFRNTSIRPLNGGASTRPDFFVHANMWEVSFNKVHKPATVLALETNGDVTDLGEPLLDHKDRSPARNTSITPAVSGAHPAGATDLAVDDAAGVQVGDRLHVRFAPKVGAVQMLATTVQGVDGNTLTLADALPRDLAGGEEVAAFTPAGAKPSWWNDGVA
jgi:hypothetical protein